MISAEERYSKHQVTVHGLKMAYIDEGVGDPIIFLHGNPSSSYEWRNIIPHLVNMGRCIAPDLIGMGDSDKLTNSGPSSYRFIEHRKYLDAFLETLDLRNRITLVLHDWGSALGFDWAYRHPMQFTLLHTWNRLSNRLTPGMHGLRKQSRCFRQYDRMEEKN